MSCGYELGDADVTPPVTGGAQGRPDPAARMAAQRAAMIPLAKLDGIWEIPAGPMTIRYTVVI